MSWPPSTVDSTERSWMPRFSATDAIPPVRQLARPTRRYSIGVMPLSSAAKTSGWSASNVHSSLWLCSSPRPKKLWTLIVLWTPLCVADIALGTEDPADVVAALDRGRDRAQLDAAVLRDGRDPPRQAARQADR